jgi:hypothetical protein
MPIPKKKLKRKLRTKFLFEESDGSKHEIMSLVIDGKKVVYTLFSKSHTDIGDDLLKLIARQLAVNSGYLREMYGCTKSRKEYIELLKSQHKLD